ncbi:hypothetical protein [Zunongwangia sp. H14]|uniref:hypothetical protein n=1 Tax=Zunongwangia sp. H14 TaxID=3240792 RepID=UPI003566E340
MKFDKEFKEAISHLPDKEKDKLILRLLKKDLMLANRLHFKLVNTESVEDQREKMENRIIERAKQMQKSFYSVGYLNMDVRFLSGDITEHVKITKDKFGEASLNLLMLIEVLKQNKENILSATPGKARKFCVAVVARVFKIMLLIQKLHSDYMLEFKEDLKELGNLIGDNPYLMKAAINNGLDVNWLIQSEIPEDIVAMHKDLRARGYLK